MCNFKSFTFAIMHFLILVLVRRLLDEYEAAGNDENRKRKITEEARELAKKMREEVMTPATGT